MKTKNIFRTLLMAAMLLLGANNVKAEILWQDSNGSTQIGLPYGTFTSEMEGATLRFTYTLQRQNGWTPQYKVEMYRGGNNALVFSQPITDDGSNESTFDIVLTSEVFSKINTTDQNNVCANVYGSWVSIKKIEIAQSETSGPHAITVEDGITNGTLTVDKTSAEKDETVTLTAVSAVGYKLKNFVVNGSTTKATITSIQANEDGTITTVGTFTMTGSDVTVSAEFIDKNTLYEGSASTSVSIPASEFTNASTDMTLRIYTTGQGNISLGGAYHSDYQAAWIWKDDATKYYNSEGGYYEFAIYSEWLSELQTNGIHIETENNSSVIKVILVGENGTSSKTDVTLTFSATTASATTASIGQTLANAPTLTSSVEGLTFTYESSNTAVAEVNSEGAVTIKGVGTTIIKAIFAGDDTYNKAEASYTLVVTEATYTITLSEATNGQLSVSPTTDVTAGTTVTITATPSAGYKLSTITVTGADDTNIEVAGTGNTRTFTMPSQNVTISATFTEIETVEAIITSTTGYATFSSDKALDFTGINTIEAYYAKTVEDGNVYLLRVYGTVAANTGLVIKGATTRIPVAESGDELLGNLLIGVSSNTEVHASTDYVLAEKSGAAVFAQTGANAATVAAGHAYLHVSAAQARTRTIGIGGEDTTGIENSFIDENESGEKVIYNLNGLRVKNPTKGLYIINGKKVLIK